MIGRLLSRWADPVVRRQLQRAIARRDVAEAQVRRLKLALREAERAVQTQHDIAGRWQSIATHRQVELAATEQMLRVALADDTQQGEQQ